MEIPLLTRFAPLALRLVLGIIFIAHGSMKIFHMARTVKLFAGLGIPFPTAAVLLVIFLEIVGGLALILGIGSRVFALLLALEMVGAIVTAKAHTGFIGGWEFEALLVAGLLTLVLGGPGAFSLVRKNPSTMEASTMSTHR